MATEYLFERIGTTLTDYGDGRLCLVYGRPAESMQEVLDQGKWLFGRLEEASADYGNEGMTLLADLKKLDRVSLDDKARALYKKVIELDSLRRIAIVGDAFSFTKVMTLMVTLTKKEKVKFFFNYHEAKGWLGW